MENSRRAFSLTEMHVTQSGWTGKKGGRVRDDVQEVQPFKVTKNVPGITSLLTT